MSVDAFKEATKLVALYQLTLEQMDMVKGTPLYKQNIKRMMNVLEREIERTINGPLKSLDGTDEQLMTDIQVNIELILDMSLEEIAMLKAVVDEHRES